MRIYTRTGDDGETALLAGGRVPKDHPRIEAYGTVDELNAILGLARSESLAEDIDRVLRRIQNELFNLGAQLAATEPTKLGVPLIDTRDIAALEDDIDQLENNLPPLKEFILPGGTAAAAALHVARTVCRRAERRLVSLRRVENEPVPEVSIRYLNRLGDLLFVAARAANASRGVDDSLWSKSIHPT
jgi:cob(I)alamin adenosyltransferase